MDGNDATNIDVSSLNLDSGSHDDPTNEEPSRSAAVPRSSGDGPATGSAAATARRCPPRKKSSLRSRWLVLGLSCLVMMGSYYAYDIPSALHQQLRDYMPLSPKYETNFNLLYTVYSIPNVLLPLFGGNFVDRHGAPRCLAVFAAMVFTGSVLLSIGVANKTWEVMYVGRFVFGLGAESLCVAQSTIVSDWFEGREVAFSMGIGLAVSRLGSIWNNITSPKVANNSRGGGIEAVFWIGALLTGLSFAMAGAIIIVDKRATRKLHRGGDEEALQSLTAALLENEDDRQGFVEVGGGDNIRLKGHGFDENINVQSAKACVDMQKSEIHITDMWKFGSIFWLLALSCFVVYGCVLPFNNVASGILLERDFFTSAPSNCLLEYPNQCTVGYLQQGNNCALDENDDTCHISSSQAPVLPSSVNHTSADSERSSEWRESAYVYPTLKPENVDCGDPFWLDACTSDYCTKQNAATEHAGKVMSIPYLISAISSPPLGHLVDKIGRRAQIAVASSALLLGVHLTLALSASSPAGPLVGQGLAYSLYAAVLWPSVPLAVPGRHKGTAFGVITSVQNVGLALFPLLVAAAYNAGGQRYVPNVELFFVSCAALGVVVGGVLNRLDRRHGSRLNGVSKEGGEEVVALDNIREDGDRDFAPVEEEEYFSPLLHSG